jgi:hypothetical protein
LLTFLAEHDFTIFRFEANGMVECDQSVPDICDSTTYMNVFARKKRSAR